MAVLPRAQERSSAFSRRWLTASLVVSLLALRFGLVTTVRLALPQEPGWTIPLFDAATYLLVAALLIIERGSWPDFNLNPFALWLIILFKPFATVSMDGWGWLSSPLSVSGLHNWTVWLISLLLLIYFRSRLFQWEAIRSQDGKWALVGCLAGLVLVPFMAYVLALQIPQLPQAGQAASLRSLAAAFPSVLFQVGYAAATEEPVFRGFLWGALRQAGWRDRLIWPFQAGLFVLAHLYYLRSSPLMFWVLGPVSALLLGWLAWRSRSIATSMLAHGMMNGLTSWAASFLAAAGPG